MSGHASDDQPITNIEIYISSREAQLLAQFQPRRNFDTTQQGSWIVQTSDNEPLQMFYCYQISYVKSDEDGAISADSELLISGKPEAEGDENKRRDGRQRKHHIQYCMTLPTAIILKEG